MGLFYNPALCFAAPYAGGFDMTVQTRLCICAALTNHFDDCVTFFCYCENRRKMQKQPPKPPYAPPTLESQPSFVLLTGVSLPIGTSLEPLEPLDFLEKVEDSQ